MTYLAEVYESGIFRQSREFQTLEEREKWVEQFNAVKKTRWLTTDPVIYEVPYNRELTIKFIDAEVVPTNEWSLEEWINSRMVAGRLEGNEEWAKPNYITGSFNTSGTFLPRTTGIVINASGYLIDNNPGWYCMGT